jgi:hypothetical protein
MKFGILKKERVQTESCFSPDELLRLKQLYKDDKSGKFISEFYR